VDDVAAASEAIRFCKGDTGFVSPGKRHDELVAATHVEVQAVRFEHRLVVCVGGATAGKNARLDDGKIILVCAEQVYLLIRPIFCDRVYGQNCAFKRATRRADFQLENIGGNTDGCRTDCGLGRRLRL
jgi:hypothetical protein